MDEDQQQDDQQGEKQEEQQPIAPSAFTSFNITPVRRPISSLALFQRQSVESDEQIRGVVRKNQEAMSTAVTITLGGTGADDFVAAVNAKVDPDAAATTTTKLINIKASKLSTGEIVIEHLLGGEIRMFDTLGTPLADAGFSQTTAHAYGSFTANSSTLLDNLYDIPTGATIDSTANTGILASNWKRLSYTASTSSPTNEPADGTLWYHTATDEADILAHNGTTFIGYLNAYSNTDPNGPQFSATAPSKQSDGTVLVDNDLWIDTSDLENYPKLYKYNTSATISNSTSGVAVTTLSLIHISEPTRPY